jgi:predicted metalloprotease with PDZ domain
MWSFEYAGRDMQPSTWKRCVWLAVALLGAPTQAGAQAPVAAPTAAPAAKAAAFVYRVGMEDPEQHEFQLELNFSDIPGNSVDLQLPKWNPGAYRLTEAHRNLRGVVVETPQGKPVPVVKVDEITWRVSHAGQPFRVRYRVYRGSYNGIGGAYLDDDFGFWNGVYLFLYAVGHKERRSS